MPFNMLQVVSSGWIARFASSEGTLPPGSLAFSTPTMMKAGLSGTEVWPVWAWCLFALAALALFAPLCVVVLRRRELTGEEEEEADVSSTTKGHGTKRSLINFVKHYLALQVILQYRSTTLFAAALRIACLSCCVLHVGVLP